MFLKQCDFPNELPKSGRETLLEHQRMKKTAGELIASGCRLPLAVWVQHGLKPGGCRQYSLDREGITLGSCLTADFSSHNHTEPPLASQICHQNTPNVALPIAEGCLVVHFAST